MSNRRNGGIIGPQNRTIYYSAPGVWHLDDAQESAGAKNWPGGPSVPASPYTITYLAVAGGGGGGYNDAGGGGAGGLLTNSFTANPGTTYTINVGGGGSGSAQTGNNSSNGAIGSNTTISGANLSTVTTIGGGGGAALTNAAVTGGSGGGGSSLYAAASGTSLQGNAGGAGGNISSQYYIGGGGGGAGASGSNATSTPGAGGAGTASSITGASVSYAGGGGGGGDNRITTGSFIFNGNGNYIIYPYNSSYNFGTNNFTIECWYYPTSFQNYSAILCQDNGANANCNFDFFVKADGTVQFSSYIGATEVRVTSSASLSANTWSHIALVRNGSAFNVYINGTSSGTPGSNSSSLNTNTLGYTSGRVENTGSNLGILGYVSNLRVVNGTAVYTSNFTAPTSPLPVIPNTVLLTSLGTGFIDISTINASPSVTGNVVNTTSSPFTTLTNNITGASGGSGGGGNGGGGANGNATTGSAFSGGGGGGGAVTSNIAAAGGSGVVILSMPTSSYTGAVTGAPTVTNSGANTIVKFTGNGTYVA